MNIISGIINAFGNRQVQGTSQASIEDIGELPRGPGKTVFGVDSHAKDEGVLPRGKPRVYREPEPYDFSSFCDNVRFNALSYRTTFKG